MSTLWRNNKAAANAVCHYSKGSQYCTGSQHRCTSSSSIAGHSVIQGQHLARQAGAHWPVLHQMQAPAADCPAQQQLSGSRASVGCAKLALRENQGGLATIAATENIATVSLLSDRIPILLVFRLSILGLARVSKWSCSDGATLKSSQPWLRKSRSAKSNLEVCEAVEHDHSSTAVPYNFVRSNQCVSSVSNPVRFASRLAHFVLVTLSSTLRERCCLWSVEQHRVQDFSNFAKACRLLSTSITSKRYVCF